MIVDVPDASDFRVTASRFLSMAWETATRHGVDKEFAEEVFDVEPQLRSEYWAATADDMMVALTLLHSGIDHLLMSRIAEVSAYLLMSGRPRDWPKGHDKRDTPFADFHTIDSQELPRVHDAVCAKRLPQSFRQFIDEIRRARNAVAHSVPRQIQPKASQIVEGVLRASDVLLGPHQWPGLRLKVIRRGPASTIEPSGALSQLNAELNVALDLLPRGTSVKLLGIDKRRRRYICPVCIVDAYESEWDAGEFTPGVAQLQPKKPGAVSLLCRACGTTSKVRRTRCQEAYCRGDVIADVKRSRTAHPMCMTCHQYQPED